MELEKPKEKQNKEGISYIVSREAVDSSAPDVVVYADLHSSVPGPGKVKTAMMLRRRFLGKLPKPSLLKKYVSQSHSVS
ncbi:unnamed protein product [Brassica oleracea var. botrytis]